jgi:hypothetical protein
MSKKRKKDSEERFRITDLLIILLCLSGAVFFVNLFRLDLFSTLDSKNEKPVGTIIVKNNIVQRRMANRVLWDRLTTDSPAYMGDLIRTADISSATLDIENNSLDLGEKTLIRIQRSLDGEGLIRVDLDEGNLGLSASADGGGLILNLMGRQVEAAPGTVLNATAGKDGIVVQVTGGTATFIEDGNRREIVSGSMIALDAEGTERREKAVVVLQPRPNARYLKDKPEPLHVSFAWNRINFDPGEPLRLEIAGDRNFNRIVKVIDNLDSATAASLDTGTWYWRLSLTEPGASNRVISTERFVVAEAAGPSLLSPVKDSLFRYQDDPPQLRFQWSEAENATSYILEASAGPDFVNPRLRTQTASVFVLDSSLGPGVWYWRILPVFPSVYEGSGAFSPPASFRIEQGSTDNMAGAVALVLPEPVVEQPPPVVEQPAPAIEQAAPSQPPPRQPAPPRQPSAPRQPAPAREQPLLPAPQNLQPSGGYRIGIEELKTQNAIVFSWSAVQGANAYIVTLYEESANGRRQIIRRPPENRTSWTLENLSTLGRGNFVWQVEAVNRNSSNVIGRRGGIGEGTFIIDIPRPGRIQIEDPGTLYGN